MLLESNAGLLRQRSVAEDRSARTFAWIEGELPAGHWPRDLRRQIGATMQKVGWAVVGSGEFGLLDILYRDYVSIFPRLMVEADDADDAADLYTVMHIMRWHRTQRLSELLTFNDDVVRPFAAYLSRHIPASPPRRVARETPRIAYLSETSELFGSNAVARITVSLMLGQQALRAPADHPILYCLNEPAPDLLDFAARHGLQIRNVRRSTPMRTVDAAIAQLDADNIDILIADSNCAAATMVMQRRPVPVQAFHENGFAPWAIPELDLALMGITRPATTLFADRADEPAITGDQRDPALRARDLDHFRTLASGLGDPARRAAARPVALDIARRFGDMTAQAEQVEAQLRRAWASARRAQEELVS